MATSPMRKRKARQCSSETPAEASCRRIHSKTEMRPGEKLSPGPPSSRLPEYREGVALVTNLPLVPAMRTLCESTLTRGGRIWHRQQQPGPADYSRGSNVDIGTPRIIAVPPPGESLG